MTESADVLVVGGGPAGAAAAARLAASGLRVVLCERQADARPLVCGEFVSGVAAAELVDLGVLPARLEAHPIARTRVYAGGSETSARLPFAGYGLSRSRLDQSLRDQARACGADVRTGVAVRALERTGGIWSATLGDGRRLESGVAILATGKHELRGHARASRGAQAVIGFKMHYRLEPEQAAALGDAVELFLYDGGYAGLQRVDTGAANLCLIIGPGAVRGGGDAWAATLSHLARVAPALVARLQGAQPLWSRPATVARVPYGYVCAGDDAPDGLYRVGDQAAVIPSLTGEGIAIALKSARLAAEAVLAGRTSREHVAAIHQEIAGPMRRAGMIDVLLRHRPLRSLGFGLTALPGVLPVLARVTRV